MSEIFCWTMNLSRSLTSTVISSGNDGVPGVAGKRSKISLASVHEPWHAQETALSRFLPESFQPRGVWRLKRGGHPVGRKLEVAGQIDQKIELADILLPHKVCLINPLNQGVLYTVFRH